MPPVSVWVIFERGVSLNCYSKNHFVIFVSKYAEKRVPTETVSKLLLRQETGLHFLPNLLENMVASVNMYSSKDIFSRSSLV